MRLNSIAIYIGKEAKNRPTFQVNFGGVDLLYSSFLGKKNDYNISQINIFFTSSHLEIDKLEVFGKILNYYCLFDFNEFSTLKEDYLKRKIILDHIHRAVLNICQIENYDTNTFDDVYQKCLQKEIKCNWLFENKLFISPNKMYHIGLESRIDFADFEIHEVLFDADKNEISRRVCFKSPTSTFTIKWASWEKQNDVFYYSFNGNPKKFQVGPKKIFKCVITDLIAKKPYTLPKNVSEYFKN